MPANKQLLNLFALLDDGSVRRITTTGEIQEEISELFNRLKNEFYNDQEVVLFDGRYRVEEGEIFKINKFPIEKTIKAALENPLSVNLLQLNNDAEQIKSLFCGLSNKSIMFQVFDTRKLLSRKLTLLNSGNTYSKLSNPGIIIDNKLDVLILGEDLLFESYHNARRIFDLSSYYKEATDEDLRSFSDSDILCFEDKTSFVEVADSFVRKKVALLQKNNVLQSIAFDEIEKQAKGFGLTISVVNNNGQKAIQIPKKKKEMKEILRFLDEDYFIASLTGRKCLTNSKRYL